MAAWTAGLRAELGSCNVIIQEIDPGQTNTNMAKVRTMETAGTGMNGSSQLFVLNLFWMEYESCHKNDYLSTCNPSFSKVFKFFLSNCCCFRNILLFHSFNDLAMLSHLWNIFLYN